MDITATLDAPCEPSVLTAWVSDLGRYPEWLEIVPRAEPAPPHDGDPGPAWLVDLRGRLGPLARSKRLRMVRSTLQPGEAVRFERRELDGRRHSTWLLEATVDPHDGGSRLTMGLHYGGAFGGPVLERMLRDEIERSRPRLLACVAGGPPPEPPSGR
ncbi:MAG TPA: SRPBCC family protein [Acidimicrobiales bacterium]|nr:SRPBCC family protein [Acidimicrobiales bacterium]